MAAAAVDGGDVADDVGVDVPHGILNSRDRVQQGLARVGSAWLGQKKIVLVAYDGQAPRRSLGQHIHVTVVPVVLAVLAPP